MEFKTRVFVGAPTGAIETGDQFAWQERLRQRVVAIEAGVAALRQNECSSEYSAAGRAGSCWRALESAELERGGGLDCCRTRWSASSGVGGREQQWSRGQATGAMPHPAQCAAAPPHRRTAELPQPPVLCCPAALPVPLTSMSLWLCLSVVVIPRVGTPEERPTDVPFAEDS